MPPTPSCCKSPWSWPPQLRAAGNDLVLVARDRRLLRAAQAEGLLTFDPENQTEPELDILIGP
jgi:hypothetical protein